MVMYSDELGPDDYLDHVEFAPPTWDSQRFTVQPGFGIDEDGTRELTGELLVRYSGENVEIECLTRLENQSMPCVTLSKSGAQKLRDALDYFLGRATEPVQRV